MLKSLESLSKDFSSLRTGRASASLLDKIRVDYYGSETPINQVATVSVPEARMIVIQPWDKSVLSAIEKAILKSDLDSLRTTTAS
jgi:ribosome recycling factor